MNRGAWQAMVHGVAELETTEATSHTCSCLDNRTCGGDVGEVSSQQELISLTAIATGASQVALVVKNRPANAGDVRGAVLISGLGCSPGGGHGNPFQHHRISQHLVHSRYLMNRSSHLLHAKLRRGGAHSKPHGWWWDWKDMYGCNRL